MEERVMRESVHPWDKELLRRGLVRDPNEPRDSVGEACLGYAGSVGMMAMSHISRLEARVSLPFISDKVDVMILTKLAPILSKSIYPLFVSIYLLSFLVQIIPSFELSHTHSSIKRNQDNVPLGFWRTLQEI